MTCNPNNNTKRQRDGCVCTDVKLIDEWQQDNSESSNTLFCTGPTCSNSSYNNTIPFQLILPSGARFTVDLTPTIPDPDEKTKTDVLRVEEVYDNCCARVRGLEWCEGSSEHPTKRGGGDNNGTWLPTEFCCTVDLNQCVGIQFLPCTCVPLNNNCPGCSNDNGNGGGGHHENEKPTVV